MDNLEDILRSHKGKKLLAIFAHPDDECFVAGGLFQVAKEYNLKTHLLCLTKGGRGGNVLGRGNLKNSRTSELNKSVDILGIDKLILKDNLDARLRETKKGWIKEVKSVLEKEKPDIVLTFDHSGITGHPDHIVSCHEVFNILKKSKIRPILLWRVPDKQEKHFFKKNKTIKYASKANYTLNYGFNKSIKKIRAIYAHKSQMKNILFKLQILEWFLFDHSEPYYKVDYRESYNYKFVAFKID